ncbi:MAG: phage virion morphogenesis protein [Moorea sp. SIO4G2]|nr:phage virion morphogenesis protein [Moorena sp. SIO4G2]
MEVQADIDIAPWIRTRNKYRITDMTRPLRESMGYLDAVTKQRFLKEQDPDGKEWAPLSSSTLKSKRSGQKLVETGRLIRSLQWTVSPVEGVYFTPVEYAIYLQKGTRSMPKRPFLGLNKQDVRNIEQIFLRHLNHR